MQSQHHSGHPGVLQAEVVHQAEVAANLSDDELDETKAMIATKKNPHHHGRPPLAGRVSALEVEDEHHGRGSVSAGIPLYKEDLGPQADNKFVKHGYQDAWAIVVFAVVMLGTVACSVHTAATSEHKLWFHAAMGAKDVPVLAISLVASIGFALASLFVMKSSPAGYIFFSQFLVVASWVAVGVRCLIDGLFYAGAFNLVVAVIYAMWAIGNVDRVPFAALILRTSVDINLRHWGSFLVGVVALFVTIAFSGAWSIVFERAINATQTTDSKDGSSMVPGLIAFGFVFVLFWGIQVGANVVHVTASGVVATWYFVGESRMPTTAVPANLKRSLTTSFGSICFGSAIVALLKTIYYFLRHAVRASRHELLRVIAMCLLGIVERLTEMFNIYAFTQVAIYGHDFITAAKQTFALVKESGWSLIINDCLAWNAMAVTNVFGSIAICAGAWIAGGPIVGLLSFLIATAVFTIVFRPVYAGVATQFVCVAENPDAMAVANPEYGVAMNALKPADVGAQQEQAGGTQRV